MKNRIINIEGQDKSEYRFVLFLRIGIPTPHVNVQRDTLDFGLAL